MDYRKIGFLAVTAAALGNNEINAQTPHYHTRPPVQYYNQPRPQHFQVFPFFQQPSSQPIIIQPQIVQPSQVFVQPQFVQPQQTYTQPIPYQTWPHPDQLQQKVENLPLDIKNFEYGYYATVIDRFNGTRTVGGLESMFKFVPATPGYLKPNNEQVSAWKVEKPGVYQILATGNDWSLKLGVYQLSQGDVIRFVKVSQLRQQDYLAPQQIPNQGLIEPTLQVPVPTFEPEPIPQLRPSPTPQVPTPADPRTRPPEMTPIPSSN